MLFVAVVASLLAVGYGFTLPGVPTPDSRVVGGQATNILQTPFIAALLKERIVNENETEFAQVCGGTVISQNAIVTAAHCVNGSSATEYKVRAASTNHDFGGVVVDVSRIVQHPLFDATYDNDIAVVFLAESLTLGSQIRIIALPTQGETIADSTPSETIGWGILWEGQPEQPSNLYKVTLPILNQAQCSSAYAGVNRVTANMVCAGSLGGGSGPCLGDSGSPLVINGFLMGIVSWGVGCARPGYPAVYTRVPMYKNWITSTLASYEVQY